MAHPGIEIERKFLVDRLPEDLGPGDPLDQGYLAVGEDGFEVRVRRRADRAYLTIKKGTGAIRVEEELEIDLDRFARLWPLTDGARIVKRRHVTSLGDGLLAEIDVYAEALAGLVLVEVEFPGAEEARRFIPPPWFGAEVTDDPRYKNQRLARDGRPAP